jgi:hypothetical protein
MRLPKVSPIATVLLVAGIEAGMACSAAQQPPEVEKLFSELQSSETSDHAEMRLLELGNTDAASRRFLAVHLPDMLLADPRERHSDAYTILLRPEWCNAALLAGNLKLVEAAPALVKQISYRTTPIATANRVEGLTTSPAGTALVELGDAAVPSLRGAVKRGEANPNMDAVYALILINSRRSREVLKEYADTAPNPEIRKFIYSRMEAAKENKGHGEK